MNDVLVDSGPEVIRDPYGSPVYVPVSRAQLAGSGGTSFAPAPTAMVVTWRTQSATRSGRGRTFLGPLASSALQTDGTLSGSLVATVQDACDDLVAWNSVGTNGSFAVYSRTNGVARDITASKARDYVAVLRSRRD